MQAPCLGERERELTHRARDAHVTQPPLLFHAARLFRGHSIRKQPFFHAGHEHDRKLEPFRRMQRHQLHTIAVAFALMVTALERRLVEEFVEHRRVSFAHRARFVEGQHDFTAELATRGDQLFEVFFARDAALSAFARMKFEQAAHLDAVLREFV